MFHACLSTWKCFRIILWLSTLLVFCASFFSCGTGLMVILINYSLFAISDYITNFSNLQSISLTIKHQDHGLNQKWLNHSSIWKFKLNTRVQLTKGQKTGTWWWESWQIVKQEGETKLATKFSLQPKFLDKF